MGISLEIRTDDGAPRVDITVDDLDPSGQTVSVQWSVNSGRRWHSVQEADHVTAFGGLFRRDHLAPLNLPVTYRVLVHDGDPIAPEDSQATVTVESKYTWISDPLAPRHAIPVECVHNDGQSAMLMSPSAGQFSRRQVVHSATAMGAWAPTSSVGRRQAPTGIPLHLRILTDAQGALVNQIRRLVGGNPDDPDYDGEAGTFTLRGLPPELGLSPVAHVVAPEIQDSPVVGGLLGPRRDWIMTVDQDTGPAVQIQIPWWTYAQVRDEWLGFTYADVLAARPGATYLDFLRDPTRP